MYEINSKGINHITINELLNSCEHDKFTLGCLLKANLLHNLKYNYANKSKFALQLGISDKEIDSYYSENEEELKGIVLSKDSEGLASFIISMILNDNDEVFYQNALKLDKTGKLCHTFMMHCECYLENAGDRILEVDKEGFYITDTLMWLDKSPLKFANKIVELENPFAILTFKNRYEEYLENVKDAGRDSGFLLDESETTKLLNDTLSNFDFDSIILTDEIKTPDILEQTFTAAIMDITEILVTNKNYDGLLSFFRFLNNYSKSKSKITDHEYLQKSDARVIGRFTMDNDAIVVLEVNGFVFGLIKDKEEYYKLCEELAWGSKNDLSLALLLN